MERQRKDTTYKMDILRELQNGIVIVCYYAHGNKWMFFAYAGSKSPIHPMFQTEQATMFDCYKAFGEWCETEAAK